MSRRKKKEQTHAFIAVGVDIERMDEFDIESISGLPGVEEARRLYPDDPALFNLFLVKVEVEQADEILETIRRYPPVEYAGFREEPEPR
jgi:hypothetical protein